MVLSIQLLRFFACTLVLFAHLPSDIFGGLNQKFCGSIGVDIFFVISGFVMYMSTMKLPGGGRNATSFFLRRANRIWPIYALFTLLFAIETAQISIFNETQRLANFAEVVAAVDWTHVFKSLLMLPVVSHDGYYMDPVLAVGWTLSFELYFYFIVSILLLFKIKTAFAPLIALSVPVTISLIDMNWSPFFSLITSPILLEFAFGYILAFIYVKKPYYFERYRLITIPIAIVLFFVAMQGVDSGWYRNFARMTINYSEGTHFNRLLAWGIPSLFVCIIFLSLENQIKRSNVLSTISLKLGDITYALYLAQIPIINFLVANNVATSGFGRIIFIFSPLLASIFIYKFIEAPALKSTNIVLQNVVNRGFSMNSNNALHYFREHQSKIFDAMICLVVIFALCHLIGQDVWAETQAEYLDCIKSLETLFSKGWFGYWALVPKLSAYIYNLVFFDATSPGIYARIATSIIVFVSMFISLRLIDNGWLKLLFSFSLTSILLHQSSFTLTNCSYILLLPLLIIQIKAASSFEEIRNHLTTSKFLYLIALLSKASFIFLVLPLTFIKNWKFLLPAFLIGGWQLSAMSSAAGSGLNIDMFSTVHAILRMFYIFVSSLGAVFDFSFLGSSLYNYNFFNSYVYFFLGLAISIVLMIPLTIEIKNKSIETFTNLIKSLAPLAILFISTLPFVIWILVFGNGIKYTDKELFAIVFTNSKLQYLVISTPLLALSLALSLGKWLKPKYLTFIIMSLCVGSFFTIKNQYKASQMAYVDSKLTFFEEFKKLPYYKCFAIPPFSSDSVLEGLTLNGQFLLGGCKRFSMHNKYENGTFVGENNTYDFSQKVGGVFTYLGIVSRAGFSKKMHPSIRFWDTKCLEISKSAKVSQWVDDDNFFYVAGLIEDDRLTPLQVNELLPYCFGVNTEQSPTSTILLMLPDRR